MGRWFIGALILAGLCGPGAPAIAQQADPPPPKTATTPEIEAARAKAETARLALPTGDDARKDGGRPLRLALLDQARALEDLVALLRAKSLPAEDETLQLRLVYLQLRSSLQEGVGGSSPVVPAGPSTGASAFRAAADRGLDWLARHQGSETVEGGWDGDSFGEKCQGKRCENVANPLFDPALTGLAVLAFLESGEMPSSPKYGTVVAGGLKYLRSIQDAQGCFGPRISNHFTYNHGIAALAMARAFRVTASPLYERSARAGAVFAQSAQNPYLAWRYGVRPVDNDTSVTGWMVAALAAARDAGIEIDPASFDGAIAWLDKVTEPEYGRVGYTAKGNGPARPAQLLDKYPSDRSESLTAEGVHVRLRCGQPADHPMVRKGMALVGKTLPAWDEQAGCIDFYYWYFGTLASVEAADDDAWLRWRASLDAALLPVQRVGGRAGCALGSWDPLDPWGGEGGRVYSTAMATLSLLSAERRAAVPGARPK